jgi:hypothetical protein
VEQHVVAVRAQLFWAASTTLSKPARDNKERRLR